MSWRDDFKTPGRLLMRLSTDGRALIHRLACKSCELDERACAGTSAPGALELTWDQLTPSTR